MQSFVLLERAADLQDEQWRTWVVQNITDDGYLVAGSDTGEQTVEEKPLSDFEEFVDIEYYNFMGSEAEPERFYVASVVALRDKKGKVWALETDEFWEF
jgi:hypothetical protein